MDGAAFVLSSLHSLLAYSDARYFGPLRSWVGLWVIVGVAAWVYKTYLYERMAPRCVYTVESCTALGGDTHDLVLRPLHGRLNHAPGEFAFLSVRSRPDIPDEPHPLSIASPPHTSRLRFGFKAIGDWTRQLATLVPGDRLVVYGPYGEFHAYNLHHHRKQIWIGGGIGITPFLSMLAYEAHNDDAKDVWLYYAVNDRPSAAFDAELQRSVAANTDDRVRYACVVGERLTAARIAEDVGDLSGVAVLMCGPTPMMRGLAQEFEALGVPKRRIYFEDFAFV
jgi:predicted ferric reductase